MQPRQAGATNVKASHGAAVPVARRAFSQAARLAAAAVDNVDAVQPFEAEFVAPQPVDEANMVADLETILKERDACGVSLNNPHCSRAMPYARPRRAPRRSAARYCRRPPSRPCARLAAWSTAARARQTTTRATARGS